MNLMRFRYLYFLFSLAVILPGLFFLIRFGLQPAIDFTGGSLWEIKFLADAPNTRDIQHTVEEVYEISSIQTSGDNSILIKGKDISNDQKQQARNLLEEKYGLVEERRFESVGPTLSAELLRKTLTAVALVAGLITLYVSQQFKELKYGVAAVIAMIHDILILLGCFSILGYFLNVEVDVLFVTALLTTLSFSVHDTIVVFDRIRELRRRFPRSEFESTVGAAVLETLGRSINNSVTIIIMLLSLVLIGGETIRWFAVALLIGAITGTYSSTFTAAPLLLLWDDVKKKREK